MTLSVPFVSPEFAQAFNEINPLLWYEQNPTVQEQVYRLYGALTADLGELSYYDMYYEGRQPLRFISADMARELGSSLQAVVLNWCRLVVSAYASRLQVDGFRYPGTEQIDADLQETWQANNLDALARQAFTEALALKRSYVTVGSPDVEGEDPVITVESPFQMTAIRDPRTRKVTQAFKTWQDISLRQCATLYLPNETVQFVSQGGYWQPTSVDEHNLGMVPVVPLVNSARILRPNGISEFHDVIPIVDAAIKAATDMMTAAEYHAIPRRWVFGVKKEDFVDPNTGQPVGMWKRLTGHVWAHSDPNVKAGQFDESNLSNFHETIKLLAQLASQIAALPANYLAFNSVNPASADAMRAIDTQLELRIDSKKLDFGEALEDVMRLVLRFKTGEWDPKARGLETVWADQGALTTSQKADAAVKLVQAKIITTEQAQEDLGYGPIARARMQSQLKANSVAALAQGVVDNFNQAADSQAVTTQTSDAAVSAVS